MSVGRIAVMLMYNVLGIVPDSYAGVITSGHDIVVKEASDDEHVAELEATTVRRRPGMSSPAPDLSRLPVYLAWPGGLQEIERTFLRDTPTQTGFIFFVNEATGVRKLVSNPELSPEQLIPGATAFQISAPVFEIFPIGQDGHTNVKTEEELPQPSLTPNLDEAAVLLDKATNDEIDARAARTIRQMREHIFDSQERLRKTQAAISDAYRAGEVDYAHREVIESKLRDAERADSQALADLNSTSLAGERKKKEAREDVGRALKSKDTALHLTLAAKALRKAGK